MRRTPSQTDSDVTFSRSCDKWKITKRFENNYERLINFLSKFQNIPFSTCLIQRNKENACRMTWTLPDYRLVTTDGPGYCYDRKSRAACAQSFALWQQTSTEIMRRNLSSRTLVVTFNRSQVNIGRASTSQSLLLLLACATHIYFFTLRTSR